MSDILIPMGRDPGHEGMDDCATWAQDNVRPFIPAGCDQQGRYMPTYPAEACTEVGADDYSAADKEQSRFVTGVLSTGIYCRPSCSARHPRRANVRFFAGSAEAREAGLRPCKRCLPDDVSRDEKAVLAAIETIKASEEVPALAGLAADAGYSVSHFQRLFTRMTGLSPAAYSRALRLERRDAPSSNDDAACC